MKLKVCDQKKVLIFVYHFIYQWYTVFCLTSDLKATHKELCVYLKKKVF